MMLWLPAKILLLQPVFWLFLFYFAPPFFSQKKNHTAMARNVTCQSAIGNFPPTVFQQLWRTAYYRYLPPVSISSISIHCMNYFAQIIDIWHCRFHCLSLSLWINKEGTFLFRRAKQVTTVTNISLLKKVTISYNEVWKPEPVVRESNWT